MGLKFPQTDLPVGIRGGSDSWDDGLTGQLLLADFFAAPSAGVFGELAATESGSDTLAASGAVGSAAIVGTLSANEAGSDAAASTGAVRVAGALSATESGADTLASSGSVRLSGGLSAVESGSDSLVSSGSVRVSGTLEATESGADTLASVGTTFPEPGMQSRTRAAGGRKNYLIKGQRYSLTDRELGVLIQQMLNEVKRPEIQVIDQNEVKQISRKVWKRLKESLTSLDALSLDRVETAVEQIVPVDYSIQIRKELDRIEAVANQRQMNDMRNAEKARKEQEEDDEAVLLLL